MRLAVITSHPVQYNAPWFRLLAEKGLQGVRTTGPLELRVFYLWNGAGQLDRGFGRTVTWDIPLLEGYAHEFVPNCARKPGPGRISGLNNPALSSKVAAFQPDAVLIFGYNYLSHYRFLRSRFARSVPLLFRGDSHRIGKAETLKPENLKATLRRWWIARVFQRFSAFLYVGQANRDYFLYHGVPGSKLFFSPHCVDNARFISQREAAVREAASWKAELGIPPSHRVVLFAGKFEPKKRPGDLIEAYRRAKLRETTLLLVGNGPLESELRSQAAGSTNIIFAPFQNQTRMPRTYATADLFVLPSFGAGETWGLAVNEAMCLGRTVVVSDHVGCARDLVQPGRNGLVFEAGNVSALSTALCEAFADPERLRSWGECSRKVIEGYSYEKATEGLIQAFAGLRAEPRSNRKSLL